MMIKRDLYVYDVEKWTYLDKYGNNFEYSIKLYIEHYNGIYDVSIGADDYCKRLFVIGLSDKSVTLEECLEMSLNVINDYNDFKDYVMDNE